MSKKVSVIRKELEKEYGEIFIDSEHLESIRGAVIPTTLSLDIGLHGGIVEGTIISIAGNPGSGKTSLCLTIISNAQKLGKTIYYIDVEGRLQPELLKTIPDLNLDNFHIIRSTKEKFLTAEDFLNIINKIIATEENVFIVLDSVASLCAETSYSSEHGEAKAMMGIPRLMYESCRKAAQILPAMKSNIVYITHVQANPSPYGGPAEVGGNAIKYQASYRLTCMSSSETPKDGDKAGNKTGRESKFKIYKSAIGPGTGDAIFYIRYGHGYDREMDIVNVAEELGFIMKAGAWFSFKNSEDKEVKVQGTEKLVEYLRANQEESDYLDTKIRKLIFKKE